MIKQPPYPNRWFQAFSASLLWLRIQNVPALDLTVIEGSDDELDRARFSQRGWSTDFNKGTVPISAITSGWPGKDGIPAIDYPRFESDAEGDLWLVDTEPKQVVEINEEVKAYPLGILI